jgi:hypothetical protein
VNAAIVSVMAWASALRVLRVGAEIAAIATAVVTTIVAVETYHSAQHLIAQAQPSQASFRDPAPLTEAGLCSPVPEVGLAVGGTARMRRGEDLWLIIRPPTEPTLYITSPEPVHVSTATHTWSGDTGSIGSDGDHGAVFELLLVAATTNGTIQIQAAYEKDFQLHSLLAGEMTVIGSACVRRE